MQGWIKLHRQIMCHWLYPKDRAFTKFEAWIDLLLQANHSEKEWFDGTKVIDIPRGTFITSEQKLMSRWGWSKTKVRKFLTLIENESMIVQKKDRKKTTLSIVNYGLYQDRDSEKRPQKDRKKTTERPQKDPTKNVKNGKNEKEINMVWEHYESKINEQGLKRKKTQSKLSHINARLEEGFSAEELIQVIDNVFADDFMRGDNDRQRPYLEIDNFMTSAEKVEKHLARTPKQSQKFNPITHR